jgi:hypothetical protein
MYRQSPAEAARVWNEIRGFDWTDAWGDDAMARWHALLRKGHAAEDIADFALDFMWSGHEVSSLGDFLAGFESYEADHHRVAA